MTTNNATIYEPFDLTTWKRTHPKWIHNASPKEQELFYELTTEQKQDIVDIHRMAKTLHRIAENQCNGHPSYQTKYRFKCDKCGEYLFNKKRIDKDAALSTRHYPDCGVFVYDGDISGKWEDEEWAKRDELKKARYEARIKEIATRNNWIVDFQGDPRGAVVKLEINGRDMTNLIFA